MHNNGTEIEKWKKHEDARSWTQREGRRMGATRHDATPVGGQNPRFTAAPFQIASPRTRAQPIAKQARNTAVSHVRL
eukprot:14901195-Alexandrium_andersonii.AAC.1